MLWLESHICDWSHASVTGITLMQLESRICDWGHAYATGVAHQWLICDWSCTYASESQIGNKPSCKYTGRTLGGHAHQHSIYRRPSGPHFLSLYHVLLYFYTSNIDHPFTTEHHLSSARDNRHSDYNHYQGVAKHHWQQPISHHVLGRN